MPFPQFSLSFSLSCALSLFLSPSPYFLCVALQLSPPIRRSQPMHQLASTLVLPPLSHFLTSSLLLLYVCLFFLPSSFPPPLPLCHLCLILQPPWWTDNCPAVLRPWVPASAKVTKVSVRFHLFVCPDLFVCVSIWLLNEPKGRADSGQKSVEKKKRFRGGIAVCEVSAAGME